MYEEGDTHRREIELFHPGAFADRLTPPGDGTHAPVPVFINLVLKELGWRGGESSTGYYRGVYCFLLHIDLSREVRPGWLEQ